MLPSTFYKYRRWDDKYHRRSITLDTIFFSSARRFNDPFDCYLPVPRYDLLTDDEHYKKYVYHLRKQSPRLSEEELYREATVWLNKGLMRVPEYLEKAARHLEESKYNEFGIFSLSEVKDNILLWSHYSDSHKGFCIGYDPERLDAFLANLAETDNIPIPGYSIEYRADCPELNPSELDDEKWVVKQLTTKSELWRYEKEYRYILIGKTDVQLGIQKGIMSEVILGCKMPEASRHEVIDELRKKPYKVRLYWAERSSSSFRLEFHEIDY
jgi:hypothetical protein